MKSQLLESIFSDSKSTVQWNEENDLEKYIKVSPLTPEIKAMSKEVVDEMMLLLKEHLNLLTEDEQALLQQKRAKSEL